MDFFTKNAYWGFFGVRITKFEKVKKSPIPTLVGLREQMQKKEERKRSGFDMDEEDRESRLPAVGLVGEQKRGENRGR